MQGSNLKAPPRAALTVISKSSPRRRARKGIFFLIVAFGVFPAGMLVDRWTAPRGAVHSILPFACFAGYLFFGGKALATGFPGLDRRWRVGRRTLRLGIVTAICLAPIRAVRAQQTIFNVPTADVLDGGKLYFENDDLWRSWEPRSAGFTFRGVVGLGSHVEAGVNFAGLTAPGRSVPTATLAAKWQPIRTGEFAVTTGVHALFFLRGAADGTPGLHGYVHASYRLPTQTRLTAGTWFATSGYAAKDPVHGGLFGFEQPVAPHLALIADMYTGKSSIGSTTYGIEPTFGLWTIYAGYSVKNGNSRANALLIEIGVNP